MPPPPPPPHTRYDRIEKSFWQRVAARPAFEEELGLLRAELNATQATCDAIDVLKMTRDTKATTSCVATAAAGACAGAA